MRLEARMPDSNNKQGEKPIALGIAFGVAIGAGIGAAMNNVGLGISLGIAIGAALGHISKENQTNKDDTRP